MSQGHLDAPHDHEAGCQYDTNSLFMIVPKAKFKALNKVESIIKTGELNKDLSHYYDNLVSESDNNLNL